MTLEGVGVPQPAKHGPMQLRLKLGKQAYCVIELRNGEDGAEVARKLREFADQVDEFTVPGVRISPSPFNLLIGKASKEPLERKSVLSSDPRRASA